MYMTLFCILIPQNNTKIPDKDLLVNEYSLECGNFLGGLAWQRFLFARLIYFDFLRCKQSSSIN